MRLGEEDVSHAAGTGASEEPTAIKIKKERQLFAQMDNSSSDRIKHEKEIEEEDPNSPETDPSKNGSAPSNVQEEEETNRDNNTENNVSSEKHVDSPTNSSSTTMPGSASVRGMLNYDVNTSKGELTVKIICLGDSAVGKSK